VRDCLHPADLGVLVLRQLESRDDRLRPRLLNVSGGTESSMSLAQLTEWCDARFGRFSVEQDLRPRPFDMPWMVLDASIARDAWTWAPSIRLEAILDEIALHAQHHPNWLEISGAA
jgi:CDP-paratose 2-epimerase